MRTEDAGRINIVWVYFQKTSSIKAKYKWKHVHIFDISKEKDRDKFKSSRKNYTDPMFVLKGEKL